MSPGHTDCVTSLIGRCIAKIRMEVEDMGEWLWVEGEYIFGVLSHCKTSHVICLLQ